MVSALLIPIKTQKNNDGTVLLDGKANISHIVNVSKARLQNKITKLSNSEMKAIDDSLAQMLKIKKYYINLEH